jgi:rhamnosyltransferase
MSARVCVLLAACDGERFLAEQIESIRAQSYDDWVLLIRDDASRDATPDIIQRFCRTDERIHALPAGPSGTKRLGAKASFSELIQTGLETDCERFFLADQDDTWQPQRIEKSLAALSSGRDPRLAFCNHEVVDEYLAPVSCSRLTDRFDHERPRLVDLLSLNYIPGCTIAFNRKLAEIASPVPDQSPMHDWWLALTAASLGAIRHVDQSLVKYRQHGGNEIGAAEIGAQISQLSGWPRLWRRGQIELRQTFVQAAELARRLGRLENSPKSSRELLELYAALPESGRVARLRTAAGLGLRRQIPSARMVLLSRLLFMS